MPGDSSAVRRRRSAEDSASRSDQQRAEVAEVRPAEQALAHFAGACEENRAKVCGAVLSCVVPVRR